MRANPRASTKSGALLISAFLLLGPASAVRAQDWRSSLAARGGVATGVDYVDLWRQEFAAPATAPLPRAPRLQFFGMPSGFLANPIGLLPSDDTPVPEADPYAESPGRDDGSLVYFSFGRHIPNLDIFQRGNAVAAGYYRLNSQVKLVDTGASSVCIGLQAFAPAGLAAGGAATGPTMISPAIACFQELYQGAAVHAFVSQSITADSRWREQLNGGVRCGIALQHPVPGVPCNRDQGLFLFVQGLALSQAGGLRDIDNLSAWEVIPGMQWRVNTGCWLSVGLSHSNFLSCSWQY